MDMFAYIFLPMSKKYLSVKSTKIENFWYETPGLQSKEFASKTFTFTGKDNKREVCQILIVAATLAELNKLNARKRITVPKLNNSDLRLSEERSESDIQKTKVKQTRSNLKKDITQSMSRTNSNIIKAHLANNASKTRVMEKARGANNKVQADYHEDLMKNVQVHNDKVSTTSQKADDDEMSTASEKTEDDKVSTTSQKADDDEMSTASEKTEDDKVSTEPQNSDDDDEEQENALQQQDLHNEKDNRKTFENDNDESQEQLRDIHDASNAGRVDGINNRVNQQDKVNSEPAFCANNMTARLLEENNQLKKEISKLRRDKVAADRLNRTLHEKFQNYKEKMNKKSEGKIHMKLKPKGLPTPICCNSGIFVRADALEDAYTQVKPSMFYERMCYLTWGRRVLAHRCLKKNKKTPSTCTVLTPRKRRAVRQHFVHYLKYYKYHSVLFNKEINKMNDYAHRAIVCSKRYAELVQNYPEIATDEELEDVEMCEL